MPDLEQIGAVDDVEHLLDVLLDDQHGESFGADAAHEIEHLLRRRAAQGRRTARPSAAAWAATSARGRWRTSAARRPTACRRAASRRSFEPRKQIVDPGELLGELRARRRDEGADAQIVLDGEPRKQPAVLRHMRDALLDDAMRRQAGERPCRRASWRRERNGTSPEMTRISVVLPAPFGPMTPTASPAATSSETSNRARKEP